MASIEKRVYDIPMDQLETAEGFALESLQMDRERVMKRYEEPFNDTLERCRKELECKGICEGFAIESKEGDEIRLEGGIVLKSGLLSSVMQHADEIVAYAVAVVGHDELLNDPENSMLEGMFYNAWGVGLSMSAHRWLKRDVKERAEACGRFAGRGWVPGEEDLELSLQHELFELIDPSIVGITVSETGTMRPVMSVSGFMGISNDAAIQEDGIDIAEHH